MCWVSVDSYSWILINQHDTNTTHEHELPPIQGITLISFEFFRNESPLILLQNGKSTCDFWYN